MVILVGIALGFILSLFFSFGPGFWGLLQNSIHYGYKKGAAFEIGVNASDIMMVVLMLTIMNKDSITLLLRTPVASIIGGTVVIVFGLVTFLRRPSDVVENKGRIRVVLKKVPRRRELALHGFALNTMNPSVWLYWAALTAVVKSEIHMDDLHCFMFFISMLLAELACGLLKCFLASKLQHILAPKFLARVNRIMGSVLMALGIYLIVSMVVKINHPERPDKEPAEVVTNILHQSLLYTRDSTECADGNTVLCDTAASVGNVYFK
ncbi:MAG: LysE family transporter [Bacteroidales bacterium]|nr:LysE family transporter [Bacteroidales bacterium]